MTNRAVHTLILSVVLSLAGVPIGPSRASAQSEFVNEVADGSVNVVGSYSSLALDAQGNAHVGYYNSSTNDLKYARKSGGIWTIEVAEASANDVGAMTSLALDAQGNPHLSYYDGTTGDLKYARKSGGVWANEIADGSANVVGQWTSLALDAQGNPHVSHYDATTRDLKYARKSGGVWTIETADGSANFVGEYTSLALDAQGNPHVSYYDATTANLKYARKSAGAWTIEIADGSANFVGQNNSLALDAQGNPHVSYYDATTFSLKYARKSGGVWAIETADAPGNGVGQFNSLALDVQGNPHVAYWDATAIDLKYARKSGGVWTTEIADAGGANLVGSHTSLALDAQGNPHISYLDLTTADLKFASAAVHLLGPAPGITWAVGSRQDVAWSGVGPIAIALATDGINFDNTIATGIISSPFPIRVPHLPTRFARIRIERASPLSTAVTDSFFTIDATIALLKFNAESREDDRSVTLSWETDPGRDADVRYRLERASSQSDMFAPLHTGLLDRGDYLDRHPGPSARYRLIAVNGLGEEYALGETAISAALGPGRALAVTPNPSVGGAIRVLYHVGTDFPQTDVAIYDASGRRVRTLVSGTLQPGVGSAAWDARDESGRPVSAGVYFVRLAWGGIQRETARLTVIR